MQARKQLVFIFLTWKRRRSLSAVTWLEFIAEITESIAWPLATVLLLLSFRRQIVDLLKNLTHFKVSGVEASFGQQLAKVEEKAERLTKDSGGPRLSSYSDDVLDPSGLVLRSWSELETELVRAVSAQRPDQTEGANMHNVSRTIERAREVGLLPDPEPIQTIQDLRGLRNKVAHGQHTPTAGEALTYQQAVSDVLSYLATREDWLRSHGK